MGRFFLNMIAAFAELERNLIAERTATALAHKKAHREAYAPTPCGFERVGETLRENTQEQETIAQIFAWRRAGWSLRKVAAELNCQECLPSRVAKEEFQRLVLEHLKKDRGHYEAAAFCRCCFTCFGKSRFFRQRS